MRANSEKDYLLVLSLSKRLDELILDYYNKTENALDGITIFCHLLYFNLVEGCLSKNSLLGVIQVYLRALVFLFEVYPKLEEYLDKTDTLNKLSGIRFALPFQQGVKKNDIYLISVVAFIYLIKKDVRYQKMLYWTLLLDKDEDELINSSPFPVISHMQGNNSKLPVVFLTDDNFIPTFEGILPKDLIKKFCTDVVLLQSTCNQVESTLHAITEYNKANPDTAQALPEIDDALWTVLKGLRGNMIELGCK